MGDNTPKTRKPSDGAVVYLPLFRPFKACQIARREMEAQPEGARPDRTVDVRLEVEGKPYEFTMAEFLGKLGIPARSELTDNGDGDAA